MSDLLSCALLTVSSLSEAQSQWLISNSTGNIYATYRRRKFQSNGEVNVTSLGKPLHECFKNNCVCVCRRCGEVWRDENSDCLICFLLIQAWVIGIDHEDEGGGTEENNKASHYKSVPYCLQLQAALRINFY